MQIIRLLSIVLIVTAFVACNNYTENGVTPSYNVTYLRFVSPSGTNVLDSLNVLEEGIKIQELDPKLITIIGRRISDGKAVDLHKELFHASKQAGSEFEREETLIKLEWNDFNIWDVEKRDNQYEEIYEIHLQSSQIFCDNATHHLKWYVNVLGREHNAYKCEVDGQEVSLDNDPLYNLRTYDARHEVAGFVTFYCK